jgi:hypothetical protein
MTSVFVGTSVDGFGGAIGRPLVVPFAPDVH